VAQLDSKPLLTAGRPPQLAFRRAVQGAEGPLAEALREVVDATDLGGRWRDELKTAGDASTLPTSGD
jgi:Flp pilus assembly protein TadB